MSGDGLWRVLRELQDRISTNNRVVADLERNAAFWLSVRGGTNAAWSTFRISFELGEIEPQRLGEAPYLAAIGFLVDTYSSPIPLRTGLSTALERAALRAAHTAERTGYADNPLVVAGLILLAKHLPGQSQLAALRSSIDTAARLGPAEALVVAAVAAVPLNPVAIGNSTELDLSCLVLGRRILRDSSHGVLARTSSADPESELSKLALTRRFDGAADFPTMVVAAALETIVSGPRSAEFDIARSRIANASDSMNQTQRSTGSLWATNGPRALIMTAIPIEYQAVRALLDHLREVEDDLGTVYELGVAGSWEVAIAEFGPGNSNAAAKAERAIQFLRDGLTAAVFVGVAGGIKDVALGDVVVATKICNYEIGKDTDEGFRPRPDVNRSSYRLVERARAEARKPEWAIGVEGTPKVVLGAIAAGEKVVAGKGSSTATFLRDHYGDVIALEMEGAGVLRAAEAYDSLEVLVVRGVSDLLSGKSGADAAGWQPRAASNAARFALQVLKTVTVR